MKYLLFSAFAATIPIANWLIGNFGTTCIPDGPCLIPVGFGLMAPSGVLMIGLALVLRDWLHEWAGWRWSFVAVLVGGALSLLFSPPTLSVASAAAFTLAEMADLAVYSKLRERGKALAVMASQIVGAALDSSMFVYLAFGSLSFSAGTTLAKIYAGAVVALILFLRGKCLFGHGGNLSPTNLAHPFKFPWKCKRCGEQMAPRRHRRSTSRPAPTRGCALFRREGE